MPETELLSPKPIYVLDQLELDYRAEVIAAELTQRLIAFDQLLINPTGSNNRPYSKDYDALVPWVLTGSLTPYYRLDTPREGLYDQLPPSLFHPVPNVSEQLSNVDSLLERVRLTQEEEQDARLFFLPFDTELHYLRVLRNQRERSYDRLENATTLIAQFAEGWPILTRLDPFYAGLFIQLLPLMHQLRGNLSWLGHFLSLFFHVPIRLETDRPMAKARVTDAPTRMGTCQLGVDAIVGDTFDDGNNAIHLIIGPVPEEQITDFLPKSPSLSLLDELLAYFMPISAEVIHFIIAARSVDGSNRLHTSYLGYNSYL